MKTSTEIAILTIMGDLQEKKKILQKEVEAFSEQIEDKKEQIRLICEALDLLVKL